MKSILAVTGLFAAAHSFAGGEESVHTSRELTTAATSEPTTTEEPA